MALIPVLYLTASYIIKVVTTTYSIVMPAEIYLLMATKSPLIHIIFYGLSFFIKYRKRIIYKAGVDEQGYQRYLESKRNAWTFSKIISF